MSCTLMLLTFVFMGAKMREDSTENKSIEKNAKISTVFIVRGTIIYGVEKIINAELRFEGKKTVNNIPKTHIKDSLKQKKKVKKENLGKKENTKDTFENKIKITNKDTEEKYLVWLSKELKAIADSQYKSSFTAVTNQTTFELFSEKALLLKPLKSCKKTFAKNRTSYIRPPPII